MALAAKACMGQLHSSVKIHHHHHHCCHHHRHHCRRHIIIFLTKSCMGKLFRFQMQPSFTQFYIFSQPLQWVREIGDFHNSIIVYPLRWGRKSVNSIAELFENQVDDNNGTKRTITLGLWDTAGQVKSLESSLIKNSNLLCVSDQEEYDRLRPLSYPNTVGWFLQGLSWIVTIRISF